MTFDKNDRDAIEQALADPEPNPITEAVNARCQKFLANLNEYALEHGKLPDVVTLEHPDTAFDDNVIQRTLVGLAEALGQTITIGWVGPEKGHTTRSPFHASNN